MAAAIAKELSNIVTCPVCLDMPKNPKAFPCLHFYCESCIDDLRPARKGSTIGLKCPVCREFSLKKDIKPLHFMNELLDAIQSAKKDTLQCGNCKDKKAQWRCEKCKDNFCDGCRKNHDGFNLFKAHKCLPLEDDTNALVDKHVPCPEPDHEDEYVEFFCKDCQKLICRICNGTEHKLHKAQTVKKTLEEIIPMLKENEAKITDSAKALAKHMSENVQLKENISKEYEEILSQITAKYLAMQANRNDKFSSLEQNRKRRYEEERANLDAKFEQERVDLELERNSEMNIIENDYDCIHSKANETKQQHIQRIEEHNRNIDLQVKSQQSIAQWARSTLSSMKGASLLQACLAGLTISLEKQAIDEPTEVDIERKPIVVFKPSTSAMSKAVGTLTKPHTEISRRISRPLDNICKAEFVLEDTIDIEFQCYRITMVDDKIWCSELDNSNIDIYSTDGIEKRTLAFKDIGKCRGIATSRYNVIIAAVNGLFMTNKEGKGMKEIDNRSFIDVTAFENKLFALESNTKEIHMLGASKLGFEHKNSFGINQYTLCGLDTIQASQKFIYIGLINHDIIAQYTHMGELVATYGEQGSSIGHLSRPRICGVDDHGMILIADFVNNRFVTLKVGGTWAVLPVPQHSNPRSAFVTKDNLIVCCRDNKLRIYTITMP